MTVLGDDLLCEVQIFLNLLQGILASYGTNQYISLYLRRVSANHQFTHTLTYYHLLPRKDMMKSSRAASPVILALHRGCTAVVTAAGIEQEVAQYRKPAEASAGRGFKLIVYGHTHLAKRVSLRNGGARYLNCGTWADLMGLPPEIYSSDKAQALTALAGFVAVLQVPGRIKRNQVPTFVRIDMGQDNRCDGSLLLFRDQKVPLDVSSGSVAALSTQ